MNGISKSKVGYYGQGVSKSSSYYGGLPEEMYVSKFEETNMDIDEMDVDNYQRMILKDRRPDNTYFEHERPRKNMAQSGVLGVLHNGSRSGLDPPAHPEMFLGFIGPDNIDPRGYAEEPDFNKLREQEEIRTYYIPFGKDTINDLTVTGGGRNQDQTHRDKVDANIQYANNMKIFSTERTGDNPRALFAQVDNNRLHKQLLGADNGFINWENLEDYKESILRGGINPKEFVRMDWFQKHIADCGFKVAAFNVPTIGNTKRQFKRLEQDSMTKLGASEHNLAKTIGILMGDAIKAKFDVAADQSGGASKNGATNKSRVVHGDMIKLLQESINDWKFSQAKVATFAKRPERQSMYTGDKSFIDDRTINRDLAITNLLRQKAQFNTNFDLKYEATNDEDFATGTETIATKSTFTKDLVKNRANALYDLESDGKHTFNYKTSARLREKKLEMADGEEFTGSSIDSVVKQTQMPHGDSVAHKLNSYIGLGGDNTMLDRKTGVMGNKRVVKYFTVNDGEFNTTNDK